MSRACSRCGSSAGAELETESRDGRTTYRFRCIRCRLAAPHRLDPEIETAPRFGDLHGHPGCFGCQACFADALEDEL